MEPQSTSPKFCEWSSEFEMSFAKLGGGTPQGYFARLVKRSLPRLASLPISVLEPDGRIYIPYLPNVGQSDNIPIDRPRVWLVGRIDDETLHMGRRFPTVRQVRLVNSVWATAYHMESRVQFAEATPPPVSPSPPFGITIVASH